MIVCVQHIYKTSCLTEKVTLTLYLKLTSLIYAISVNSYKVLSSSQILPKCRSTVKRRTQSKKASGKPFSSVQVDIPTSASELNLRMRLDRTLELCRVFF